MTGSVIIALLVVVLGYGGPVAWVVFNVRRDKRKQAARVPRYFARRVAEADKEHEDGQRLLAAHEDDVNGGGYRKRDAS